MSKDINSREYIGTKYLKSINGGDMEYYKEFRDDYAKINKHIKNKGKQNYKDNVALATLKGKINHSHQFLCRRATKIYFEGRVQEWKYKPADKNSNHREALSIEQYRTLTRYMRSNEYLNKADTAKLEHQTKG